MTVRWRQPFRDCLDDPLKTLPNLPVTEHAFCPIRRRGYLCLRAEQPPLLVTYSRSKLQLFSLMNVSMSSVLSIVNIYWCYLQNIPLLASLEICRSSLCPIYALADTYWYILQKFSINYLSGSAEHCSGPSTSWQIYIDILCRASATFQLEEPMLVLFCPYADHGASQC